MSRIRAFFASNKLTHYLVLVAVVLTLPALFHGFEVDDRLQRIGALGQTRFGLSERGPFELYTFLDGEPSHTKALIDAGVGPWWTDDAARLAFFRPISSFLLWTDHHFLKNPILIHVHSVIWYLATVAVACALYRRFIRQAWVAGLAAAMFALDHTHGLPAAWIAQRNTLITGLFGLCTIYFHDRARRGDGRSRDPIIASICLGLGLCSGEASLGVVPYLLAHAWTFDRPQWLRPLLPYAPPLLLWLVIYKLGSYGAHGSGLYVDPGYAPLAYLANVAQNGPLLVGTELGVPGVDFHPFLPRSAQIGMGAFAIFAIALFLLVVRPLCRVDPTSRFFVLGGMLAVLPSCATFPSSRLTFLASFGLLGALSQIVAAWRDGASWFPQNGFARLFSMPIVLWSGIGHLVLSPFVFVLAAHQMTTFERIVTRLADGLPNDARIESQRLVIVNPPEPAFGMYILILRSDMGLPTPSRVLSFSSGSRSVEIERTGENTLLLSSNVGLVQPGTDLLTRDDRPFAPGFRVDLSDVSIEVMRVNEGGWPIEAKFAFAHELENDAYRFMQWKDQTLVPLPLPKIGERIAFPGQVVQLF